MKKELKSGILSADNSADKSADCRPTVGGAYVIAVLCYQVHSCKFMSPLPKKAPYKIWLILAKRFQRRRCLKQEVIYMYIVPGQEQTTLWANIFANNITLTIW